MIEALDTGIDGGWNLETGAPSIGAFAGAVQLWAIAWAPDPATVDDAAAAFNTTPALIRQAVEWHPWMFLAGDVIEQEGE